MTWTGVKTWNSGDLFSITDHNNYTNNNMNMIFGDPAWVPLTTSLGPNWTLTDPNQQTYAWPAIRQEGNWVRLKGWISSTTAALTGLGDAIHVPTQYIPPIVYYFTHVAASFPKGVSLGAIVGVNPSAAGMGNTVPGVLYPWFPGKADPTTGVTPSPVVSAHDLSSFLYPLN